MRISPFAKRNLYYTRDHEWIDFQGSVAYIGVCAFKLKGIRHIQKLQLTKSHGMITSGQLVATIFYDDYNIPVHMPVDGELLGFNEALSPESWHFLLDEPETRGWIALIVPSNLHERKELIHTEHYELLKQGKFQ